MSIKCSSCGCDLVDITAVGDLSRRLGCINTRCELVAREAKRVAASPSFAPVIKALGLDGQMVTALTISMGKDGVGRMTVERVMSEAQVLALAPYLRDPETSVNVTQTVGGVADPGMMEAVRRAQCPPFEVGGPAFEALRAAWRADMAEQVTAAIRRSENCGRGL